MKMLQTKKFFTAVLLFALCAVGLVACTSAGEPSGENNGAVAATVNGIDIYEDDVTDYIESFRASQEYADEDSWGNFLASSSMTPETFRTEVIDYFISEKLIIQAAEEKGLSVSDEEIQEKVDQIKENYPSDEAWQTALSTAGTTEDEYRDSVRSGLLEQKLQEKILEEVDASVSDDELLSTLQMYSAYFSGAKRSSHILFNTDDKETAEKVLQQLKDGEIEFEDAAAEYSQDGSGSNGGDVGWDILSNFVSEYTEGLEKLSVGDISDLVESEFGYHIIKCTEEYIEPEGGLTAIDQMPEELVDYLRSMLDSSAESQAVQDWFTEYKEAADIVYNDMPEGLPYAVDMSKYEIEDTTDDDASIEVESVSEPIEDDAEEAGTEVANDTQDTSDNQVSVEDEGAEDAAAGDSSEDEAEGATTPAEQPAEISSEAETRSE